MSLKDLLSLAPIPCLDLAVALVTSTYENAKNVKVYKQQCQDMSNRCVNLLLALNDGMRDQPSTDWATELENVLRSIDRKVQEWARLSRVRSFLQQSEIHEALDGFQRSIDGAMMKYHISSSLELRRNFYESRATQERDRAEIRELLQSIVQSTSDMKALLDMHGDRPVEEVMGRLQVELMDPAISEPQERSFREGLWVLHQSTSKLPPLTDLTGQVSKEGTEPAFFGTYNDIFKGRWLDREKVALRLPKNLPNRTRIFQRFEREVAVWRQFDHPNVLPLYGVAKIGDHVYSVSPWMENGTAIDFVQEHPGCDRLKMLSEINLGLEYLHSRDIIHGDLRGANVLISDDGIARLADFGLSKFLGDCGHGTTATNVNPRWFAPELIKGTGTFSKQSDIWSLAMTFLEILTGAPPFGGLLDVAVMKQIVDGQAPQRPKGNVYAENGLNNEMWHLIKSCWKKKPAARPSIQTIRAEMEKIRTKSSAEVPLDISPPTVDFGNPLSAAFARPFQVKRKASEGKNNVPGSGRPSTGGSTASSGSGKSRFGSLGAFHAIEEDSGVIPADFETELASYLPLSPQISTASSDSGSYSQPYGYTERAPSRPIPVSNKRHTAGSSNLDLDISSAPRIELRHIGSLSLSPSRVIPSADPPPAFRGGDFNASPPQRDTPPPEGNPTYSLSPVSISGEGFSRSGSYQSVNGTVELQRSFSKSAGYYSAGAREHQQSLRSEAPLSASPPQALVLFPPTMHRSSTSIGPSGTKPASVSSGTGTYTSGLEEAIYSPESRVYTRGGEVIAGTFEGFVERLIVYFTLRTDQPFRDVFLTACVDLVTPDYYYSVLARRFEEANSSEHDTDLREQNGIQATIYMVMISWLKSRRMPVTMDILTRMKNFCQASLRFRTSTSMIGKGNDLLQLIDQRIEQQADSDQSYSPNLPFPCGYSTKYPIMRPQTPYDLAIALTLLEGEKYSAIMPCDYLAYLRGETIDGYHNPVDIARVVNNHLIQWVKQSLLHYDEVLPRADVIKFYIHAAEECRNLRNFSSLIAIAIALDSAPVERLKLTKRQLSPKLASRLDEIVALVDPSNNHTAYRALLREVSGFEYKLCVPWLALHLKQINVVLNERHNGRVVTIDQRPFINLTRYSAYVKTFEDNLVFKAPNLDKQRNRGHLAYLEQRLADVRVGEAAEQELMARSIKLEEGETKMIRNHTLELAALGFSKPRIRRATSGQP